MPRRLCKDNRSFLQMVYMAWCSETKMLAASNYAEKGVGDSICQPWPSTLNCHYTCPKAAPACCAHVKQCAIPLSRACDRLCAQQEACLQAVNDAKQAVDEITVPPSAGRSEPATKTVVQAIAVAQALRSRVAHRLHYIASQTGILDPEADSASSSNRCALQ